jgi:DNA helicase-2/ATP-dependent DNA helicase PcrA
MKKSNYIINLILSSGGKDMNFYIRKDFTENIPVNKKDFVLNKLLYFADEIIKNRSNLFNMPKGFWINKVKSISKKEDIFKFRINRGDRILFKLEDDTIVFLDFCDHDRQILRAQNISDITAKDEFNIDTTSYDDNEQFDNEVNDKYSKINFDRRDFISYGVSSEKDISLLLDENNSQYNYLLNSQQKICLSETLPHIVSGSAGSGKTTIGLRKLISLSGLEEMKIGYFTFSPSLKKYAKEFYDKYKNVETKSQPFFRTFTEYALEELQISNLRIATYEMFNSHFKNSKDKYYKELASISTFEIWNEIRNTIKGYMGNYWDRSMDESMISFETYEKLSDKFSNFEIGIRKIIYKFCAKEYYSWLEKNKLLDENDLALLSLKIKEEFNYIIVDEVQDLTESQIFAINNILKTTGNILYLGDIHQNLHPTFMNFGRISLLHKSNNAQECKESSLSKNYRSQEKIIDLANKLTNIRTKKIGSLGPKDYKETSIRDGAKPFIMVNSNTNIDSILSLLGERAYLVVIVPDEEEKEKLIKMCEFKDRIFTVHEAKGLEYQYAVCYNFISKHTDYWNDIFSDEAKRKSKFRYYFNIFYVAITRAKENLLIIEDTINCPLIQAISELINRIDEFDINKLNLTNLSTRYQWKTEGQKLEDAGKLQEGIEAFKRAFDKEGVERCQIKLFGKIPIEEIRTEVFNPVEKSPENKIEENLNDEERDYPTKKEYNNYIIQEANNGNADYQLILGEKYYREEKYEDAYKYLELSIKANPTYCAYDYLAIMCYYGKGCSNDFTKAYHYFKKAKETKLKELIDLPLLYYIASMNYYGIGTEKNIELTIQNVDEIRFLVSCLDGLFKDEDLKNSHDSIVKFFEDVAGEDIESAQTICSYIHSGIGGYEPNRSKFEEYLNKSAEKGDKISKLNLGFVNYRKAKNEEERLKAIELIEVNAEEMFKTNDIYARISRSPLGINEYDLSKEDLTVLEQIDKMNSPGVQFLLGLYYFYKGDALTFKNKELALTYFKKSSDHGYALASFFIGEIIRSEYLRMIFKGQDKKGQIGIIEAANEFFNNNDHFDDWYYLAVKQGYKEASKGMSVSIEVYERLKKDYKIQEILINNTSQNNIVKQDSIKPKRNDLCPCGSGKKYKKCCDSKK